MRPIYETDGDREQERLVLEKFCRSYGEVTFRQTPKLYPADALLFRNDSAVAWGEVRRRDRPMDRHNTVFLNVHKYVELMELKQHTKLPVVVIWAFEDAMTYWMLEEIPTPKIVMKGRTDRGDDADVSPAIMLPTTNLKRLT